VYARWVAASTNASNAPFTVQYSGGSQAIAVNQRSSGGQWMLLGSFAFTAGTAGSVTLTDNANGVVIADAVKLVATSGGTTSEVVRYLHTDPLHTPRLATNGQAQVIWRWEGEAFGATAPNEDPDGDGKRTTINLRYAGQYYDAETGLNYNWNRYYDPTLGRYISSDPIGLTGGLNTYLYVGNNPSRFIDPWGLEKIVTIAEGGGSGAYGATVTVVDTTSGTTVFNGQGSTLPNSPDRHNTVAPGTYDGTNTTRASGSPGIFIGETPTAPGSPRPTARDIFVHCGFTATNRGSEGCQTIKPSQCEDFFRQFGKEEPVTVIIRR
jgi:RHS repeat-associated protein